MDKKRKQQLKREWQANEKAKRLSELPLDSDELHELANHLEGVVPENGCDHTLRLTFIWLEEQEHSVEHVTAWLRSNGMYCDCEVVLNLDSILEFG